MNRYIIYDLRQIMINHERRRIDWEVFKSLTSACDVQSNIIVKKKDTFQKIEGLNICLYTYLDTINLIYPPIVVFYRSV